MNADRGGNRGIAFWSAASSLIPVKLSAFLPVACLLGTALSLPHARGEIVITEQVEPVNSAGIAVPAPTDRQGTTDTKPEAESAGKMVFLNRDQLAGKLLGISDAGFLRWESPAAEGELQVRRSAVREVLMKPTGKLGSPTQLVQLANGDVLPGTVESLDTKTLTLSTAYAGTLKIPRERLARITPIGGGLEAIYEGPGGKEGWKSSNNSRSWRFADGGMIASRSAYIGRDMKLPDVASIEFDLEWKGQLQMMITLYTDQFDNPGGNAYTLQMNNNYVYLQRMVRNGSSRSLGQSEVQVLRARDRARIGILVSKPSKTFIFTIDGKPVQQWTDSGEFVGTGTGVLFYSQVDGYTKISNIVVREWDGRTDVGDDNKAPEADTVVLGNKDKVSGEIQSLKSGKLVLSSPFAPLEIPLERVREIRMGKVEIAADKPVPEVIRLHLGAVGTLTCEVEAWEKTGPRVKHPAFGVATVDASILSRIEFNLDQKSEGPAVEDQGENLMMEE